MGRGKKAAKAKEDLFKRLYGVKTAAFKKMLSILQKEYDELHKNGGKPPKLTVEQKLYITLKYLREYRTMDSIVADYGVCKGSICLAIQWVENTLKADGTFALSGKKVLKRKSAAIQYAAADITESPEVLDFVGYLKHKNRKEAPEGETRTGGSRDTPEYLFQRYLRSGLF